MVSLDPVSEIKSRLSIEDVVSQYVQLKRTGRSLKGLCPFHNEKTPSFHVSPERQIAYCFGCNKGGDIFSFIQEIEGLDFKGALQQLAERAGVSLEASSMFIVSGKASKDQRELLFSINQEVSHFYKMQLSSTPEGAKALHYLQERGFNSQILEEFQVGLAPDSFHATYDYLAQKNYSKKDLLDVGLLVSKDFSSERVFDRFHARIMFPIFDVQGRVIGFGGRTLKSDEPAKYMNSPESILYHKSEAIYGLHRAKPFIRKLGKVVVVEGYMDVMASAQAGVSHVVASSGTALTLEHLKLLKRFASTLILAFDTDKAGEEALYRAVELAQPLGLAIHVVRVPHGKDPDECIRHDPLLWANLVEQAPFYLDYYLSQLKDRFELSTAQGKKEACRYFFPLLRRVSSLERDHYITQLALLFRVEPRFLYEEFNAFRPDFPSLKEKKSDASLRKSFSQEEYFVGLLLRFPEQVNPGILELPDSLLETPLKKIYTQIISQYNSQARVDVSSLFADLEEAEVQYSERLMLFAEASNVDLSPEMVSGELQKTAQHLLKVNRIRLAAQLMERIRSAQQVNDKELEHQLFQEYSRFFHPSL